MYTNPYVLQYLVTEHQHDILLAMQSARRHQAAQRITLRKWISRLAGGSADRRVPGLRNRYS